MLICAETCWHVIPARCDQDETPLETGADAGAEGGTCCKFDQLWVYLSGLVRACVKPSFECLRAVKGTEVMRDLRRCIDSWVTLAWYSVLLRCVVTFFFVLFLRFNRVSATLAERYVPTV